MEKNGKELKVDEKELDAIVGGCGKSKGKCPNPGAHYITTEAEVSNDYCSRIGQICENGDLREKNYNQEIDIDDFK